MPLVAPRPRPRFHPLTVTRVRRLTADAVEVTLAVPEELASEFRHGAGQYVTVRAAVDGQEVVRSYSLCSPPEPGVLRLGVKGAAGGVFSTWATTRLAAGDVLDVMRPTGAFVVRHEPAAGGRSRYVAVVGGSGITPVLAIVRDLLTHEGVRVDLVDVNRTGEDVMFAADLDALERDGGGRLRVHHVWTRVPDTAGRVGRLDRARLAALLDTVAPHEEVDEWFLCGPGGLVDLVRTHLDEAGVDPARVSEESFASSGTAPAV